MTGPHSQGYPMFLSGLVICTAACMAKNSLAWWVRWPSLVPRRPGAVECGSGRSRLVLHLIQMMKTVSQGHKERKWWHHGLPD